MPVTIETEPDNLYVLRISGVLNLSEFGANQIVMASEIDSGIKPRILVVFENFGGWEKGVDWSNIDFFMSHGDEIAKIAIVGEPRWEAEALAFAGAGFRSAPVQFFPADQLAEARAWLAS